MPKMKIQTGLRLDEDIYLKIKAISQMEGRSINNLIEFIVRQYVADHEKKFGKLSDTLR